MANSFTKTKKVAVEDIQLNCEYVGNIYLGPTSWRGYGVNGYVYGYTTVSSTYGSSSMEGVGFHTFVARRHKTDGRLYALDSKTGTFKTKAAAQRTAERRAYKAAGMNPPQKKEKKKRTALRPDETYCVYCQEGVRPIGAQQVENKNRWSLVGECPNCSSTVRKFVKGGRECPNCYQKKPLAEFETDYVCRECRYG